MTRNGTLYVLAAAALWGTTGTARHFSPEGTPATTIGLARLVIGAVGLAVAVLVLEHRLRPPRRSPALLLAAAGMAAYQPFFFAAVERTGVAVGTIAAIGTAPVLAGILGAIVHRERVGARWVAATALAVVGAAVLIGGGRNIGVDTTGVALAIGAGGSYAVFAVAAKGLLARVPPVVAMASVFALAAILLSPYAFLHDLSWAMTVRGSLVALHLGLVATAAAYVLFALGLRRVTVASAATLSLGEPLTAAMLGIFLLGEALTAAAATGGLLLVAGLGVLVAGHRAGVTPPVPPI